MQATDKLKEKTRPICFTYISALIRFVVRSYQVLVTNTLSNILFLYFSSSI